MGTGLTPSGFSTIFHVPFSIRERISSSMDFRRGHSLLPLRLPDNSAVLGAPPFLRGAPPLSYPPPSWRGTTPPACVSHALGTSEQPVLASLCPPQSLPALLCSLAPFPKLAFLGRSWKSCVRRGRGPSRARARCRARARARCRARRPPLG